MTNADTGGHRDDRDKAFLMGTVLIRLAEYRRMRQRAESGGAPDHAVEMFAGLLAEIRAYGEGLIIAEQICVRCARSAPPSAPSAATRRSPRGPGSPCSLT